MPYTYNDIEDNIVRLVKAGAVVGSNLADTVTKWPSGDTVAAYGGSTNLWGTTWSVAEVNAADFGVVLSALNVSGVAKVDGITATVYYSLPTLLDNPSFLSVLRVASDRVTARPDIYQLPRSDMRVGNDPNLDLSVNDAAFWTNRYYWPSRTMQKTFTGVEFKVELTPATNTPGLQIWAAVDGGTAFQLRNASGAALTIYTSGAYRAFLPRDSTAVGEYIQYGFIVPAATGGQSDVAVSIRDFRRQGALQPRTRNRILTTIVLGPGEFSDLTSMRRTTQAQRRDLLALCGPSATPIPYSSPWGDEGYLHVTKVTYREAQNKHNETWTMLAEVEMMETLYA